MRCEASRADYVTPKRLLDPCRYRSEYRHANKQVHPAASVGHQKVSRRGDASNHVIIACGRVRETWINFQILWYRLAAVGKHLGAEEHVEEEVRRAVADQSSAQLVMRCAGVLGRGDRRVVAADVGVLQRSSDGLYRADGGGDRAIWKADADLDFP